MVAKEILVMVQHDLDFLGASSSFIAAFLCVGLAQSITREQLPLVDAQRASLIFLAIGLFANGVTYYPDWQLSDGRRPTGVFVDVMLMMNLIVMIFRAYLRFRKSKGSSS
jgi:hypothetical protein